MKLQFFCESHSNSLERKRGLFDVKENYFYKCGNKKVFHLITVFWYVSVSDGIKTSFIFIGRGENRHRGVSYRVSPQCGETAWKHKNVYFLLAKCRQERQLLDRIKHNFTKERFDILYLIKQLFEQHDFNTKMKVFFFFFSCYFQNKNIYKSGVNWKQALQKKQSCFWGDYWREHVSASMGKGWGEKMALALIEHPPSSGTTQHRINTIFKRLARLR